MFSEIKKIAEAEKKKKGNERKVLPEAKVRLRPKTEKSEAADLIARYMSGTVSGLNILKAAGKGMDLILTQGLDPKLEYEADLKGINYTANAGYDPMGYINYLCRIANLDKSGGKAKQDGRDCTQLSELETKKKDVTILDRTHPPIQKRIEKLNLHAKSLGFIEATGAKGSRRLLHYKEVKTNGDSEPKKKQEPAND